MKCLIKTGDEVQLVSGFGSGRRHIEDGGDRDDLGRRGRVRQVLRSEGRVIVEGMRTVRKATRPDPRKGHRGGFVDRDAPIPISNVMLVCKKCDRPVRARLQKNEEGKKERVCRKCGETI
ncbi:MAG: 50S ribosomal protein L24 [Planctomycetota bacterium]